MKGVQLQFFVHERRKHGSVLMYEWLLEQAKRLGIHGGSAFRAIAGFGRHGVVHEERFFELAGDLPVQVVFIVTEDEARRLLDLLEREKVGVFYVRQRVEYGVVNDGAKPG